MCVGETGLAGCCTNTSARRKRDWINAPYRLATGAEAKLCECGNQEPGQVNSKDATPIQQVACIDATIVRFSAPSAEGEPETQAGSIRAPLLEGSEQCLTVSAREPAAFVLDFNEHAIGARTDA